MKKTFEAYIKEQMPDISWSSAKAVLDLKNDGGTVPFIARYRKEKTGNLDEVQIRQIIEFEEEYNEVPEESDIERWEERTGKNYKEVVVDNMVRLALENIDAKWDWYEGEWRNGYGSAS